MAAQGLQVTVDAMGNMFGLLDWVGPDASVVMTGSHLDSQPQGGRFDGAYGVVVACEAVRDRVRSEGVAPRCNLAVVNWTNEEGARFQPSLLGSAVFAGLMDLPDALGRRDGDGVSVADALEAIGYAGRGVFSPPQAYVELHVECGSVLERAGGSARSLGTGGRSSTGSPWSARRRTPGRRRWPSATTRCLERPT